MRVDLSKVVTLDFESYYDPKYSLRLKTYNTSSYIRDPQFKAHCVALKFGDGETVTYRDKDIKDALHAVDWKSSHLLCQNTAFDGLILSHHYGIVPAFYYDTMSMARGLHANMSRASLAVLAPMYGVGSKNVKALANTKGLRNIPEELWPEFLAYNAEDTRQCYEIFKIMSACFPEAELDLIDLTIRMFCEPKLYVDVPRAQAEVDREIARKAELVALTGVTEADLQSSAKLAALLRAAGAEVPMKLSARTKMQTFAFAQTDEEFVALAAHPDEKVRHLVQARLGVKSTIGETRAGRFVTSGQDGQRLPIMLNYFGAHTGRWSGGDKMNAQNLPKEERDDNNVPIPLTGELRKSIIAPPGHQIVVCDSKQIECRVLAWLAGQQDMLDLFATNGDPYCALATEIYGRSITKADPDERAVGKCGVLGLGFYMGAKRFMGTLAAGILGPKLDMPLEECQAIVDIYRSKNRAIKNLWRKMEQVLYRMLVKKSSDSPDAITVFRPDVIEYDATTVWLPNGMGLHYPDLHAEWNERFERYNDYSYRANKEFVHIHSGLLTENIVQALARIIVGLQMLEIAKRYSVVMMSHDEIACIAKTEEAQTCLDFMVEQMSIPPLWASDLPLGAEGGFDVCYSK